MTKPKKPPPAPGQLLIAGPDLTEGIFARSVVLVLDSDGDGALGVIINEISQIRLESVLPAWVSTVSEPRLLFSGGPVSPNGAICLASTANSGEDPPGWRRLFDNIGLLHLDTPLEIVAGAYDDLRIFAGYAGWEPGQLQNEIASGMWYVVAAEYADVFGGRPYDLWRRALRRQPNSLAFLSAHTDDPSTN